MTGSGQHTKHCGRVGRFASALTIAGCGLIGVAVQYDAATAQEPAPLAECSTPAPGENDCSSVAPRYDLALVMRLARNQVFFLGNTVSYEIEVANRGAIASGTFSVQHAIAAGMSFVAADRGGISRAGTVTWIELPELQPGEHRVLAVSLRLDAVDLAEYRNIAEISADSGDDWNSVPDNNPFNDSLVDNDDVDVLIVGDSDDHDIADITAAQVRFDNQQRPAAAAHATDEPTAVDRAAAPVGLATAPVAAAPPVASFVDAAESDPPVPRVLPATGRDVDELLLMAVALTSAGLALMAVRRSQMIHGPRRGR